jgi:hypothetical protein
VSFIADAKPKFAMQKIDKSPTSSDQWADFASRQPAGFRRGDNDCCSWVAEWASHVTGQQLKHPALGQPLSDEDAQRLIEEAGSLEGLVNQILLPLGWLPVSRAQDAPVGSIALLPSFGGFLGHTLGIVRTSFVLARMEPRGVHTATIRTVPKTKIISAWSWV